MSSAAGVVLVAAGVAWSASGTISATLHPDTVAHASTFHLLAQGPFPSQRQLPRTVEMLIARGFTFDPRAVVTKCSPGSNGAACPSRSQVGSGEADVQVSTSVGFGSGTYNVPFRLYLGPPLQAGDVASVVLQGSFGGRSFTTSGRVFRIRQDAYGLEVQAQVPQTHPPPGVTVTATLQRLTVTIGASRRTHSGAARRSHAGHRHRHRHRARIYSLITNPPRCPSGGWPGQAIIVAGDGSSQSFKFAASCRAR